MQISQIVPRSFKNSFFLTVLLTTSTCDVSISTIKAHPELPHWTSTTFSKNTEKISNCLSSAASNFTCIPASEKVLEYFCDFSFSRTLFSAPCTRKSFCGILALVGVDSDNNCYTFILSSLTQQTPDSCSCSTRIWRVVDKTLF